MSLLDQIANLLYNPFVFWGLPLALALALEVRLVFQRQRTGKR